MEYLRELASRVLDLPWAVADLARRAARPVRRSGEELWSSVLDLPWLARDAWKRVELVALGPTRSRLRATFVALVAASAVLLVVPGFKYFASDAASGGVAGAATPVRQVVPNRAETPATAFEPRARKPRFRERVRGARAVRPHLRVERRARIDRLAATARRASRRR